MAAYELFKKKLWILLKIVNLNQSKKSFKSSDPVSSYFEYTLFRKDRNTHGGGLIFYVNQDLSNKMLNDHLIYQDLDILVLRLKVSKTNWLINILLIIYRNCYVILKFHQKLELFDVLLLI